MSRTASEIINAIGSRKTSTISRIGIQSTRSKKQKNAANARILCRVAMRYPTQEIIDQLEHARLSIAARLLEMTDDQLKWLLGGSAHSSRGGFEIGSDGCPTDNAILELRQFLGTPQYVPPHQPQSLITRMETLCTAIGYRSIPFPTLTGLVPPTRYATEEEKRTPEYNCENYLDGHPELEDVHNYVRFIMQTRQVPPIGEYYTERSEDNVRTNAINGEITGSIPDKGIVEAHPAEISSASDIEDSSKLPHHQSARRVFRRKKKTNQLSWPAAADAMNIPIRHHVSASVPLALSALDAVCADRPGSYQYWLSDDLNLLKIAGAFAIATYDRGDFHSIAETAFGVQYYVDARATILSDASERLPATPFLEPKEALASGLDMLVLATTDTPLFEGEMTIRSAVKELAQNLLTHSKADPILSFANKTRTYRSVIKVMTEDNQYDGDDEIINLFGS